MLAVVLFIAFWVVLGLAVFFVAGGVGGSRESIWTQGPSGRRFMTVSMVLIYVVFGVALPVIFLVGNRNRANAQVGGIKLTAGEKNGRQIFAQRCGFCHQLAASNTVGKVGPNLDQLRPPYSLVLNTIINGCLQNPPSPTAATACLGYGNMPANVVQSRDAQNVASFVAKVAGRE